MTTFDKVKEIVVEQLGVDEADVAMDSTFIDDLGADSLDIVELIMAFEEEFNIEIPDEIAEKIKTVRAALNGGVVLETSGIENRGIGLIAASGMPFDELRHEIRLARSLTKGIIGINAMVAAREFAGLVRTAIEEGIDLVVAGAGFSRDIFAIGKESGTPIVPIVSSAKLARISESLGASAVIVEGKEAGGHLGTDQSVRTLLPEIKKAVKIPVIGAGGVISGRDIVELLSLGADGVQMGTRFAASVESNAAPALKEFYLKAKPED
ncbi:hypothetical protein Lal_00011962, partial [Lupinus albus]